MYSKISKTKPVLAVGKRLRRPLEQNYNLDVQIHIENADSTKIASHKLLGLHTDEVLNCTYEIHVNDLCKKLSK